MNEREKIKEAFLGFNNQNPNAILCAQDYFEAGYKAALASQAQQPYDHGLGSVLIALENAISELKGIIHTENLKPYISAKDKFASFLQSQSQQTESKILSFDDNGQLVDKSQAQQPSKNIADVLWGNKALMALNADLGLSMDQLVKVANAILQSQAQQQEYTFDQLTKMMMQAATKEGHKVTMKIKWALPPAPEGEKE